MSIPHIMVTFLAPTEVIRSKVAQESCKEELDLACLICLCPEEFLVNAIISLGDDLTSTIWNLHGLHVRPANWADQKEKVIYYLSKKFTSCEINYIAIEKMCYALAWASRKLRQYMLYYTTWLISRMDPIKYIFESQLLQGRSPVGKSCSPSSTLCLWQERPLRARP